MIIFLIINFIVCAFNIDENFNENSDNGYCSINYGDKELDVENESFTLFNVDNYGIIHLSCIARKKFKSAKNPSIVMFCGPTRAGKSTTSSNLISGIGGIENNVFKSEGGMKPCTKGFLCVGPISLKKFNEKFKINVGRDDEHDIFIVDTEGLDAIKEQTNWIKYGLICLFQVSSVCIYVSLEPSTRLIHEVSNYLCLNRFLSSSMKMECGY
jgi:hypothetical protein